MTSIGSCRGTRIGSKGKCGPRADDRRQAERGPTSDLRWPPGLDIQASDGPWKRPLKIAHCSATALRTCGSTRSARCTGSLPGGDDALLATALAQAGSGLALLLVLIDDTDNAFAHVHSAAVSIGTVRTRSSVPLLSAVYGALCTVIALAVPMAKYQNFLPSSCRLLQKAYARCIGIRRYDIALYLCKYCARG
jgi:hypothetical protein